MNARYKGLIPGFYQLSFSLLGIFFLVYNGKLFLKGSEYGLIFLTLGFILYAACIVNAFLFFDQGRWNQALFLFFLLSFIQIPAFFYPASQQFLFANGFGFYYFFQLPEIFLPRVLFTISNYRFGPEMAAAGTHPLIGINFIAVAFSGISFFVLLRAQKKFLPKKMLPV